MAHANGIVVRLGLNKQLELELPNGKVVYVGTTLEGFNQILLLLEAQIRPKPTKSIKGLDLPLILAEWEKLGEGEGFLPKEDTNALLERQRQFGDNRHVKRGKHGAVIHVNLHAELPDILNIETTK